MFETDDPNKPFGPRQEYLPRRESFGRLLMEDRLLPLAEMIATPSSSFASDRQKFNKVYPQGYAFVMWLASHHKRAFAKYLRRLNALPPGVPRPETQVRVFVESFGDIAKLEARWLRYERGY